MKIIIPFKKEVVFKDNLSEITSISLEETLSIKNDIVEGNFLITGEYRTSTTSKTVMPFNLDLPFASALADQYDASEAVCDIDDFYYEIINDQKLAISIDISVDKLKEKEIKDMNNDIDTLPLDRCVEDMDTEYDIVEEKKIDDIINEENIKQDKLPEEDKRSINEADINEPINSIFNNLGNQEEYISYSIYIVREGDTIDSIITKYNIDIELIKEYNDISDLKIGDKIIIPSRCEN